VSAKILVVEDEAENRLLIGMILSTEGYQVIPAVDGADALARLEREPPDLILLDLMMPQMNGFEVLERLRADPATAPIPVIVLTALAQERDIERAVASGAQGYVIKPFEPDELLKRIEEFTHACENPGRG
jgi:two-component system sensor histidine kinase/response regulator